MKNKGRMIEAAIELRCASCFARPSTTLLVTPATIPAKCF